MHSSYGNVKNNQKNKRKRYGLHVRFNIFVVLLVTFVMVAAMQALELNMMLSEAKSIGNDIAGLRADNVILLEQGTYNSD